MKKVLVLMLILGIASTASAYVVQVETDGVGTISGNTGLDAGSQLVVGDQIKLKITLTDLDNYPYRTYAQYDGYVLSTLGVTLDNTDGEAFGFVKAAPIAAKPKSVLAPFSALANGSDLDINGAAGDNNFEGYCAGAGNPIVWNVWWEITVADGSTLVDMVLDASAGTSWYKPMFTGSATGYTAMVNTDLGDLTLHTVPEPMTIALLGLGGLFLRRKK